VWPPDVIKIEIAADHSCPALSPIFEPESKSPFDPLAALIDAANKKQNTNRDGDIILSPEQTAFALHLTPFIREW
jgi:hypothetical protein